MCIPVHQLFIDFKKAYDSVRREVLYKILIEFGIPRKLVRLIKMSLTETYSRLAESEFGGYSGGMVTSCRNILAKSKQKCNAPSRNNNK